MASTKAAVCLIAAALAMPARAEEGAAAQPAAQRPQRQEETPVQKEEEKERAAEQEQEKFGESISVTATRTARRTRDVPQAITVVGQDAMEDKVVTNVREVLVGTPGVLIDTKNGGYDARLLIRGAGLKANYGVREIMVLRDGVPLTDPDSLTRLDWIDTQDIERIEIAKGPGNLFSPGSAGGAVQILSRSVFDPGADTAEASYGSYASATAHLRKSAATADQAFALTASYRQQDNAWRVWNDFSTFQASLKHGVAFDAGGTIESEVAYTQADAQLPGVMDRTLYDQFVQTGEQTATSEPWKNSGRYSKAIFVNSKLERRVGDLTLKPRVYYNQWTHVHPVTGFINRTGSWTRTVGTDLESQHEHAVLGGRGTLVAGLTAKGEWNDDVRRYEYRDVTTSPAGRITATLSDAPGPLMETQAQRNVLLGAFAQETLRPHDRVLVDVGARFDRSWFHIDQNEMIAYDFAAGRYVPGAGPSTTAQAFDLPAPKVGVSVRLASALTAYGSAARAAQIPSETEITANPDLDPSATTAYEVGLKARSPWLTADVAAYWMDVTSEIVASVVNGETVFQNAGATRKKGIEAAASFRVLGGLELGASYAYSDYRFVSFDERVQVGIDPVTRAPVYATVNQAGNRLPYVPKNQYGAFVAWRHPTGFRIRVQANTWGQYWIDNSNTATYPGYAFLTSVGAAYAFSRQEIVLDVENALDARYAMQVVKDANGKVTYAAGTPRYVSLAYRIGL